MLGMFAPGQAYPADGPGSPGFTVTLNPAGTSIPANFVQGAWLAGNEHANDMLVLVFGANEIYQAEQQRQKGKKQ